MSRGASLSVVVRIEPRRPWFDLGLADLWASRELLYFFVVRDLKVRYRQTAVGAAWVVFQPLATAGVFSVLLGSLAGLPSQGLPYPVFVFAAILPWQLFANSISRSTTSLVTSAALLTKVYFPRILVPLTAVASCVLDFLLSLGVLAALIAWYRVPIGWQVVTLPLLLLAVMLAGLAVSLWLSALNVHYRDVQHALPFVLQLWMFLTPVVYSEEIVPPGMLRVLSAVNPVTPLIRGFRWALLGSPPPSGEEIWTAAILLTVVLVGGLLYYHRREDTFADVV